MNCFRLVVVLSSVAPRPFDLMGCEALAVTCLAWSVLVLGHVDHDGHGVVGVIPAVCLR